MADNSIAGATAEARRIFSLVSANLNQRDPCKYDNLRDLVSYVQFIKEREQHPRKRAT